MVASWRPATGSSLDERFQLIEELGVSPTGVLHAADGPDGPVVVKFFHPGLLSGSFGDTNRERLRRAQTFTHPSMAAIYEMVLEGDVPYVVMERISAPNLADWMRTQGRLAIEQVFLLMETLVEPLHAMHLGGGCGNLRPNNIFVEPHGGVRITDPWFLEGLAELPEGSLPFREMAWLAPEQTRGGWTPRGETDAYGLALLMGYLLSGSPVMGGRSLIQQRVIVPEEIDAVFKRATQMRADERYGAILDVWAAVDLAWRTTQEPFEHDDSLDRTRTGESAGLGWSPVAVEETMQVPPPSSLAALRESQESDAEAFESLEAQLTESQQEEARLEMQDRLRAMAEREAAEREAAEEQMAAAPPVSADPVEPDDNPFGVEALETESRHSEEEEASQGDPPEEVQQDASEGESMGRETAVIPRGTSVAGGEMTETSSVSLPGVDTDEGESPEPSESTGDAGSVTSTINVRVGTTVAQPSGGADVAQDDDVPSVQIDPLSLVPPTMPGDGEQSAIPVVSLDSDPPADTEDLERTIRQVPGPGTSRALEAAIQARAQRSRGEIEGESITRAGAALEATIQDDKLGRPAVPITVLAPLMLLLALLFALFLMFDLQREPDLSGSASMGEAPTAPPGGEGTAAANNPKPPVEPSSQVVADTPAPAVAPEMVGGCPADMAKVSREGRAEGETASWCVERYEYPGKGQAPRTGVSLAEAAMLCEARGGRRLCTREEWRWGCGGRYPYGRAYDADACGTLDADQKPRSAMPAGSYPRCGSSWGIYDLVGNVAEWTAGGLIQGGSAGLDGERATCNYAVPGTKPRADIGFRCCQVAETSQGEP